MASAAAFPQVLLYNPLSHNCRATRRVRTTRSTKTQSIKHRVYASQGRESGKRPRAPPGVDTRIHWEDEDEGWIGGSNGSKQQQRNSGEDPEHLLGKKFADLLSDSSGSHYE